MPEGVRMAEKVWDLANLVTGFGVVQTLAMTYAMLKGDLPIEGQSDHRKVIWGSLVFAALYVAAVVMCGYTGAFLDVRTNRGVWFWVTVGRVLAVLLFTGVAVAATYSHRQNELRGQQACGRDRTIG